jgi:hypothetical protein
MKRFLGVREWSYSADSLFGSQQHNLNIKYRNSLKHVIDNDKTKTNIHMSGEMDIDTHLKYINEFNSKLNPKSRDRIEYLRQHERHSYFDTKEGEKLLSKDYESDNPDHIKTTREQQWTAHKGAFEQVLYYSNTINDEDISREDWVNIMMNWAIHMKEKHGRVMINSQTHLDEEVIHQHYSFSCLKKENGILTYKKPSILESGYGSSLQDEFDKVFKQTIDQSKLINSYNRGDKKKSYQEVGNDHTRSKDYKEQQEVVSDIVSKISDENLSTPETLEHIRGLKKIYKGNKDALKFLNKFQSGFQKLNSEEENLDLERETQIKLREALDEDLQSTEDIVNFIKDNKEVAKSFIKFGGANLLKRWDIKKDKDKLVSVPTPMGTQQQLQTGKLKVGGSINMKNRVSELLS